MVYLMAVTARFATIWVRSRTPRAAPLVSARRDSLAIAKSVQAGTTRGASLRFDLTTERRGGHVLLLDRRELLDDQSESAAGPSACGSWIF